MSVISTAEGAGPHDLARLLYFTEPASRFAHTGSENSLVSCGPKPRDVDGNGLVVCRFDLKQAGFVAGDTQAILHGQTVTGTPIVGTAPINVVQEE